MAQPNDIFQIPQEFTSKLRTVEPLDKRTNEEILDSLTTYVPVTGERNIWMYWDFGLSSMPAWRKQNICNLVRINGPSWTVRVIDSVPESQNNALKFVDANLLPRCYVEGTMDGVTKAQHSADFLRTAAIWTHGGCWIDVGCFAVRSMDKLCWDLLEDPATPYQVAAPWMFSVFTANHFLAARKGDPFVKHWHDFFVSLWRDHTNPSGIIANKHLQFVLAQTQGNGAYEHGFKFEFDAEPKDIVEYVGQIFAFATVAMTEEPADEAGNKGFDGATYFQKHMLLFDSLQEDWAAETMIGWHGEDMYNLLVTPLDADLESEVYKKAYSVIWRILTESSMQKVTHAKGIGKEHLGAWLEQANGNGKNSKRFLDLLCYGSVHFEQVDRKTRYHTATKAQELIRERLMS